MYKQIAGAILLAGLVLAGSGQALAASKNWHDVGDYSVDGKDAVEVAVDRPSVTLIRIVCTEGSVIINTLVVREGGAKTPHTIGKRIEKDGYELLEIGETKATGFRISHDGRGKYKVQVR
jgi:hypothetical protein